jgi:hypothetical protein
MKKIIESEDDMKQMLKNLKILHVIIGKPIFNSTTDGFSPVSGKSYGAGTRSYLQLDEDVITSVADPISLCPLLFKRASRWDEVWEIANDEEKLILIQLLVLT